MPDEVNEAEPIWIVCEGSGCPAHLYTMSSGPIFGSCSMCGYQVPSSFNGVALLHKRRDIIAELQRGDFNA